MNEIEYAIKQLERRADAVSSIGEFEEYNALTTALTVIRAELARQDAKPLTIEELSRLAASDPVWGAHCFVKDIRTGRVFHAIADVDTAGIAVLIGSRRRMEMKTYGTLWLAYRYDPKGETNGNA